MKKIEKVMLVYPNQRWLKEDLTTTWNLTPYAICLLAAMVRDLVDVKIVDAQFYNLSREEFKQEIKEYQPDLVGISLISSEYAPILDIAVNDAKEVIGDPSEVSQRYSVIQGPDYDPKDVSILRVYEWDRINFSDPAKRERTAKMMNILLEELERIRRETRKALKFG